MADTEPDLESGATTVPEPSPDSVTTLDEPISVTLWRDIKRIGQKLYYVIIPRRSGKKSLRDWDLWGPLLFCFALALILSQTAEAEQKAAVFTTVFVIVWLGSVVITFNSLLLGGTVSFFQSLCIFGYCLFPLTVAAFATLFWGNLIFRLVVTAVAVAWSSLATVGFISEMVPKSRKILAVYPIVLFYLVLGWMVFMHKPIMN